MELAEKDRTCCIVEFALCLPSHLKMRSGQTKAVLREAAWGHLPAAVFDKPKL
jgi:hypothetical protein